jgi:hypothetical protein
VVRRGLVRCADLAAVWEARHLVAKLHVCCRGSRTLDVAERKAAAAEVGGRMVEVSCYNLGMERTNDGHGSWWVSGRGIAPSSDSKRISPERRPGDGR